MEAKEVNFYRKNPLLFPQIINLSNLHKVRYAVYEEIEHDCDGIIILVNRTFAPKKNCIC